MFTFCLKVRDGLHSQCRKKRECKKVSISFTRITRDFSKGSEDFCLSLIGWKLAGEEAETLSSFLASLVEAILEKGVKLAMGGMCLTDVLI